MWAIAVGGELAIAPSSTIGALDPANRANQLAFEAFGSASWIIRAQAIWTYARTADGDNSRGTY